MLEFLRLGVQGHRYNWLDDRRGGRCHVGTAGRNVQAIQSGEVDEELNFFMFIEERQEWQIEELEVGVRLELVKKKVNVYLEAIKDSNEQVS